MRADIQKTASFDLTHKAIKKLNKKFGFDLDASKIEIGVFHGRKDAGEFRWFTIGLSPEICSYATLSEFIRAKEVQYSYLEHEIRGIVEVDTGMSSVSYDIPVFYYTP